MKRENQNILTIETRKNGNKASFENVSKLTVLNSEAIKLGLLELATKRNKQLEINLSGINFIDSAIIDIFNLLSRIAHRYNSTVKLTNVSEDVVELIELVKVHAVFDIKHVLPATYHKSVA